MTPQEALAKILAADGDVPPESVTTAMKCITVLPEDTADVAWNALVAVKSPGDKIVMYSRHPYNFIFNWRELMTEVFAIVGQVSVSSDPISPIVGGCIRTIPKLLKATEVKIGDQHAKIVYALWNDCMELNPVPKNEAEAAMTARGVTPQLTGQILSDLKTLGVIRIGDDGSIRKRDKLVIKAGS